MSKLKSVLEKQVEFIETDNNSNSTIIQTVPVYIVNKKDFIDSIWSKGEVGLGESYARNSWNCPQLLELLKTLIKHEKEFQVWQTEFSYFLTTAEEDKKNIAHHYDVGNDFYKTFLIDSFFAYTCAIWNQSSEIESLEVAQKRKIDIIIRKLALKQNMNVLDIGCGWGQIGNYVSKTTGLKVTGITISEKQYEFGKTLSKQNPNWNVKLQDYRSLGNIKYDAIYSIGMFEHVTKKNIPIFFKTIKNTLKPGKRMVLHTIISGKEEWDKEQVCKGYVTTYIFPGAQIPHLSWIEDEIKKNRMQMEHVEYFGGQHYAETLKVWKKQLLENKQNILNMGYPIDLIRSYDYYFTACEASFRLGEMQVAHIIIVNSEELKL